MESTFFIRSEKMQQFRSFVGRQLERIHDGKTVEGFHPRKKKWSNPRIEETDMQSTILHDGADRHLRNLVRMPKDCLAGTSKKPSEDGESDR